MKTQRTSRITHDPVMAKGPNLNKGILVAAAIDPPGDNLPLLVYTEDGVTWKAGDDATDRSMQGYVDVTTQPACWTGDRFLFGGRMYDTALGHFTTALTQSFDGKKWTTPRNPLFGNAVTYPSIEMMAANGDGLVAVTGYAFGGYPASGDNQIVISQDFGDTWTLASLPTGVSPIKVAIAGQTIVATDSTAYVERSVYSTDGGSTWSYLVFPDEVLGFDINYVVRAAGHWWFASGPSLSAVLWRTPDLQTWERVHTVWDGDSSQVIAYHGSSVYSGSIYSMFFGGPDGRSIVALGSSGDSMPYGQIIVSPDYGETWYSVIDSYEAGFWVGTAFESHILAVLETSLDLDLYLGAAYAFDKWWITNYEIPGQASDPAMLVASSDFSTWKPLQLPSELQGDGNFYYVNGYCTIILGGT